MVSVVILDILLDIVIGCCLGDLCEKFFLCRFWFVDQY